MSDPARTLTDAAKALVQEALREHLDIDLSVELSGEKGGTHLTVRVAVTYDGEEICSSESYKHI